MKRLSVSSAFLLALTPALAYATIALSSAEAFLFDIQETSGGQLSNGTSDAYDSCYYLAVNGARYSTGRRPHTTSAAGRHIHLPEVTISGLTAQRHIYVPMSGGSYARYIDVVSNPSAAPVMATIMISGNLGSDSSTVITATSSGDMLGTTDDDWIASDDRTDGSGDPSLGHVAQGPDAPTRANRLSLAVDNFTSEFRVSIPAMGRVAVMTFAIQQRNRMAAHTEAARLVTLPADTLADADDYLDDIINFAIGGAPTIRFMGPETALEGEEITVEVMVTDREGDPPTWSWDLDDDEMFGEAVDMGSHTIAAGTTDGDSTLRLGVLASDGMEERVRYWTVSVTNVPPTFDSSPPVTAQVRREYAYAPEVTDPGGELDPIVFTLVSGPDGMAFREDGTLAWTPEPDVRGMTFPVEITASDDDEGETVQRWDLYVNENNPPTPPTPIRPIERASESTAAPVNLVVTNGTDADDDTLQYFFRLDQVSTFDSPLLMESPTVTEGPDGMTSWLSPRTLNLGLWYWQVWASDGIDESTRVHGQFVVALPQPDASVPTPDSGPSGADGGDLGPSSQESGCSCSWGGSHSPPLSHGFALFLLVGLLVRRRG